LSDKIALSVGGSQGIGAAVALEFARRGITYIIIVGRNESLLDLTSAKIKAISSTTVVDAIIADLSLLTGVKRAVEEIKVKLAGRTIDYIVETQGGPPNGVFKPTSEGLDQHFGVQVLSRFAVPYLLKKASLLSTPASLMVICAPLGAKSTATLDVDDLGLSKKAVKGEYGRGLRDFTTCLEHDSLCIDSFILEFNDRFPSINASHLHPGIIPTSIFSNTSFPFPIPFITSYLFPFLAKIGILNTAEKFAPQPVDMLLEGRGGRGLWMRKDKSSGLSAWEQVKENREKVWNALEALVNQ